MKKVCKALLIWFCVLQSAHSQPVDNPLAISFEPKLGAQVPLGLVFTDHRGKQAELRDFTSGKPTILVLGYYGCPMLCHQVQEGLLDGLNASSLRPGTNFELVVVSIDPEETPDLARAKRRSYLDAYKYGQAVAPRRWPFLVGRPQPLAALAEAVGFQSARLPDQIAHPAGLVVLSPEGRVASYLYGIRFPALALERGLKKAAQEELSSPLRRVLLLCYRYDPATGRYSLAVYRLVQWFGGFTVLVIAMAVLGWLRKEKSRESD